MIFTRRASGDLRGIENYIAERSPKGAANVMRAIVRALDNLSMFPRIGKYYRSANVRRRIVKKYRYLIYYRIDDDTDEIAVLTVQHPSRAREFADE